MAHKLNVLPHSAAPPLRTAEHHQQGLCSTFPWLQRWKGWGNKLWEHTHCRLLVAMTAIWRWRSSLGACWASTACVMQHATSTAISQASFSPLRSESSSPLVPNESKSPLLVLRGCWQTYSLSTCFLLCFVSLLLCSQGASQQAIHPPPGTWTLCWHAIDHPSPHCPPHYHFHRPVSSTSAGRSASAASLWDCSSPSWWFTVVLHEVTAGISQCLNTQKAWDAKRLMLSFSLGFLALKIMWSNKLISCH